MDDSKNSEFEIHPVIKAQEPGGKPTHELSGYLSGIEGEAIRVYADLRMSSYVEIPRSAVVYMERHPSGETGKVRVFVEADQQVREVLVRSGVGVTGLTAFPPPRFPPAEHAGLFACYGRCEENYKKVVSRARSDWDTKCLPDPRGAACDEATRTVGMVEEFAKNQLTSCISACQAAQPFFLFLPRPVAEIVAEIVAKYAERT